MLSRVRARAVVTMLALGAAAAPLGEAQAAPAEASALDEAKKLYDEGKSHYDVGDFEKALDLWKQAYAKLDDSAEMQTVRHTLVYNILEAQIRVYEVNKDITYLRRAKTLLEGYIAKHKEIYKDTPEALQERKNTEERLAEVEEMLAKAEEEAGSEGGDGDGAAATPTAVDPSQETLIQREQRLKNERLDEIAKSEELTAEDKKYTRMIAGGAVTLGVGVLMMGSGGGTTAITTAVDPETGEEIATTGGLIVGALGFVAAVTGGVVMGVGISKRKKFRGPQPEQPAVQAVVTPYATPTSWGAGAVLKF